MISWSTFAIALLPLLGVHVLLNQQFRREPPTIETDGFFGTGEPSKDDETITPFTISVDAKRLEDLKTRVAQWKPAAQVENLPHDHWPSTDLLHLLAENVDKFDWKQHQHFLNTFKHYRTEIEGLQIHFVRFTLPPTEGKQIVPLLLIHGFPGSWWHFYKVAPLLSNPSRYGFDFGVKQQIIFDVIIPSLPGFLWSDKPAQYGTTTSDVARILKTLLTRLSIDSAFVHGGAGLGADVAAAMAALFPKTVLGLHLSNPSIPPYCDAQTTLHYALSQFGYRNDEDRPSTTLAEFSNLRHVGPAQRAAAIETALSESSMGLAAFLMSYWDLYSNGNVTTARKQLNQLFTVDELLTEIHLYWLTDTIPHALRLLENSWLHADRCMLALATVNVSTAIVQTPSAPHRTSEFILSQKFHNITRYTMLTKGGLFHSLQDAHSLAADIFAFVEIELL